MLKRLVAKRREMNARYDNLIDPVAAFKAAFKAADGTLITEGGSRPAPDLKMPS